MGTGPVPNATQLSFPISDKAGLQVNVGSGNALITTSDLALPGQTLGVDYNSLLAGSQIATTNAEATGWAQREGVGVQLYLGSDGSLTYVGQDGITGKFTASGSSFTSPPQIHATLATSAGSTCGGTGYTMTWHKTGDIYCFNANGLLTSQADRNGNTTAYTYNSSEQESQVTYTPKGASSPSETVTAGSPNGYLGSLSQSGGSLGTRTVTYTENGNGDLSSVQQADGTTLNPFGYDSNDNLNSIKNGAGVTTTLVYDSSHRVTSVSQTYGTSSATATTRLSYVSSTETQVAAPNTNQGQSVASVPNTTYTVNSPGPRHRHQGPTAGGHHQHQLGQQRQQRHQRPEPARPGVDRQHVGVEQRRVADHQSVSPTGASASAAYNNTSTRHRPAGAVPAELVDRHPEQPDPVHLRRGGQPFPVVGRPARSGQGHPEQRRHPRDVPHRPADRGRSDQLQLQLTAPADQGHPAHQRQPDPGHAER